MANLPTDYQDDVLDLSQNTNRKYEVVNNPDGTISLIDRTVYIQQGSQLGAQDVNNQNEEITNLTQKIEGVSIHSSAETQCGTWVDGKPIYRKVITGTSATSQAIIDASINSNDVLPISITGMWCSDPLTSSNKWYFALPYSVPAGGVLYRVEPRISPNGLLLMIDAQTLTYFSITIEYVKKN